MKLIFNFKGPPALALVPLMAPRSRLRPGPAPSASEAADGSDPQRLVALVDYIGGDYGGRGGERAAGQGPGEYEEQVRFAADVRALGRGLLKDAPPGRPAPRRASPRSSRSWGKGGARRRWPAPAALAREEARGPLPGPHHARGAAQPGARPGALRPGLLRMPRGQGRRRHARAPRPSTPTRRASRTPSGWACSRPIGSTTP